MSESDILSLYIHENSCLQKSEDLGKKLYNTNNHYKNIVHLLDDFKNRKIFDRYFSNEIDMKTIILFMKIYLEIEKSSNVSLNSYQKIFILDSLMNNRKFRQDVCHNKYGIDWSKKTNKKSLKKKKSSLQFSGRRIPRTISAPSLREPNLFQSSRKKEREQLS